MSAAKKSDAQIIEQLQKALVEKDSALIEKDKRIALLEEYVRLHKLKRFGASSEKSPDQQELFNEAELSVAAEPLLEETPVEQSATGPKKTGKPAGRRPLPENLPRVRIEHDLPEAQKQCPCGCQRTLIGEETSEQLDIVPAQVRVLVHVRKKYACKACEEGVSTAALPPQPIPKSNASPGLLAYVATAKYQDALPLHRQEAILQRSGVTLARNTLADWMIKAGTLIQPLLNLLEEQMLAYPILHCDETPVQVLNEPGKSATGKSYMWVRVGGPPTQPIRLFHYADSRRGEVADRLLDGYCGYLQTDDYAGYHAVCANSDITQLGCWAHARRKFVEAQKAAKNPKAGKAQMALSLISRLYAVEAEIRDLSEQEKYNARQSQSLPALERLRQWLDKSIASTLPKGLLGKALGYLKKNWDKLTVYATDGRLSIDNNAAENAIRPFVVGRKNWLFSASVSGAKLAPTFTA